ncbi:MAG: diacylglycerol/lipid kinase family protein [Myxococcota bacterium]
MSELSGAHVFILNPHSAGGATRRRFERLRGRLQSTLPEVEVRLTEGPGHATELSRNAVQRGVAAVVAVGGDGTNNEVLNGFFDEDGTPIQTESAFGVVTSGTGGDFRRCMGWPLDMAADLRRIERGQRSPIDVILVTFTAADGSTKRRACLNISSFGMSGAIASRVNAGSKSLGGKASFVSATLQTMFRYTAPHIRFHVDDEPEEEAGITTVAVANGQYFGSGMWIAPDARCDDGALDVVMVQNGTLGFWLRHGTKLYSGAHRDLPEVKLRKCRRFKALPVENGAVELELDGESVGRLPASFAVLPGAVSLLR